MDTRTLIFFYFSRITNDKYGNYHFPINLNNFGFNLIPGIIISLLIITSGQTFSQQTWIPFTQKNIDFKHPSGEQLQQVVAIKKNTKLLSSGTGGVSFSVHIDGMTVDEKNIGDSSFQGLSVPDASAIIKEGSPQLPMIVKLIAIPDCDEATISITASNELNLDNYNVIPAPGYMSKNLQGGYESSKEIIAENKSIYSTDSFFPGKNGEIIETGYVRSQKVARIAIYPIQFNPVKKILKIYTDFNVILNFINPKSPVNKELGIFRNMMHYSALNYELTGTNKLIKNSNTIQNNQMEKNSLNSSLSGSVTRVNNVNLLMGTNAIPADYLIITHSSLFNSASLTKLADYRQSYNGFDVAIVQVDSTIYNAYPGMPHYQSIRNFIADVYLKGKANHTGDGHLGYIVLVGDAFTEPPVQAEMVPAAYPAYYSTYEQGGDYYYACTGGDNDDLQDLIYGRISVGTEAELSNVVNKTVGYEAAPSANWQNNICFMSFSPWFFNNDADCDNYFYQMAHIIPRSDYISYAWRAFAADTANAWGRLYFENHPIDQVSISSVPVDMNEIMYQRFTGWRWYNNISSANINQCFLSGQYADSSDNCGAIEFDTWLYNKLNEGQRIFIYEGHSGHGSLGAGEGADRMIFRVDQIGNKLHNFGMYPFIIADGCETGEFDAVTPDDMGSIDCLAEVAVNMNNAGAIGFLGSTRESSISAFNCVDNYVLNAFYNDSCHIMGEAVMESKLLLNSTFRRQYNLYGDPAVNLWNNNIIATKVEKNNPTGENQYELNNNYPNPFNPSTTINYNLKTGGFVTLRIFDVLGREIKTLVNEYEDIGSYTMQFNGTGNASGVYYYQLKVKSSGSISSSGENFICTKKMLLVK
jgi:hypothetical protein